MLLPGRRTRRSSIAALFREDVEIKQGRVQSATKNNRRLVSETELPCGRFCLSVAVGDNSTIFVRDAALFSHRVSGEGFVGTNSTEFDVVRNSVPCFSPLEPCVATISVRSSAQLHFAIADRVMASSGCSGRTTGAATTTTIVTIVTFAGYVCTHRARERKDTQRRESRSDSLSMLSRLVRLSFSTIRLVQ